MQVIPLTVRRAIEIVGLFVLTIFIIEGQQIIMPLLMAFFISIVLLPVYRFFRRKKIPEAIAIILALLLFMLIISILIWFFSWQVRKLVEDFPQIKQNMLAHLNSIRTWLNKTMNFSLPQQENFIREQSKKLSEQTGSVFSGAANSVGSIVIFLGLLPIYTFLMLYYKSLLLRFVFLWFPEKIHFKVREAMHESESIIKSYIGGLLIQITYITVLLGGALSLLGIEHALLIGIIFAILNLIPYIGALIGNVIGVFLTLSTSQELWPVITVLLTIAVVQFLDNNILMPGIVGSKIKINALAALVGVFTGGFLAGIPGMFLSLPLIAVLKVVFDKTEHLKQWGILLGDERPERKKVYKGLLRFRERKTKK